MFLFYLFNFIFKYNLSIKCTEKDNSILLYLTFCWQQNFRTFVVEHIGGLNYPYVNIQVSL